MNSILDNNQNPKNFLGLLCARLKHKYNESSEILSKLQNIHNDYTLIPNKLDITVIDQICKKFYYDFDMEKCTDIKLGYTDEERNRIRIMMINIVNEFSKCSKI